MYVVDHFAAKGQTITSHSLDVFSGGKGLNQSIALARAGADVHHAGQVGRDGMFLRDLLESCAVGVTSVVVRDDVRSGNAIIQNDASGDNCIVLYPGANRAIDRDFVDQVLDGYGKDDWLLLQNEISELPYIVSRAKARGMFIVLNPSPADSRLDEVDLDAIGCFVLNEGEAAMLTGAEEDGETLIRAMRARFSQTDIALTLGERGSMYLRGEHVVTQSAYLVDTVDTTAAGDTFTGYLLADLMSGEPIAHALDSAAKASALAVSRRGAAPSIPMREEVAVFTPCARA